MTRRGAGVVAASGVPLAAGAALAAGVAVSVWSARRRVAAGASGWLGPRVAAWMPGAPRSAVGRAVSLIWAAPITFAGLLAGGGSLVRPRVVAGVLLFAPARGVTGWVLRRRGFAAAGLGHVIVSVEEPSPQLLAHELTHVRQAERLGPLMAPAYLGFLAVHGYQRNPFEQAARIAAARAAGAGGAL